MWSNSAEGVRMSASKRQDRTQDFCQRAESLIDQAWRLLGFDPAMVKRQWLMVMSSPTKTGDQMRVVFTYQVWRNNGDLNLEVSFMLFSGVWKAQSIMGTTKPKGEGFDFFFSIKEGRGPETFSDYAGSFPYGNMVDDSRVRKTLSTQR